MAHLTLLFQIIEFNGLLVGWYIEYGLKLSANLRFDWQITIIILPAENHYIIVLVKRHFLIFLYNEKMNKKDLSPKKCLSMQLIIYLRVN